MRTELVENINRQMLDNHTSKFDDTSVISRVSVQKGLAVACDGSRLYECLSPYALDKRTIWHLKRDGSAVKHKDSGMSKFPEYKKLIPKKFKFKNTLYLGQEDVKGIANILNNTEVNSRTFILWFGFSESGIILEAQNNCDYIFKPKSVINLEFDGLKKFKPFKVYLNKKYLLEFLQTFTSQGYWYDTLQFDFCNNGLVQPLVIHVSSTNGQKDVFNQKIGTELIMPVQPLEYRSCKGRKRK